MKKYFVVIGAVILMMALASPSMAQFKSWGHMEIQTIWLKKPDFNVGAATQTLAAGATDRDLTQKHIAERFRFYLQYGDPKTVRAVIGFEADSSDWGELSSGTVAGGKMGVYRTDQVQMEIKHAYLDFVIPNTPITVTAGLQNFAYGGRLSMNNDAPGVVVTANFAPHQVQAFWWRENDGSRLTYAVNDTYGLQYTLAQKAYNVYGYFAYKNDLYSNAPNYALHPWWIGVGGGFRPGNLDLSGQFIYNGGKFEATASGLSDKDVSAWAAEAALKYRIGPGMFVGVEGFYATGNDADKADKVKMYQIPTGSESQSIFGNDRTVFFWMNASQIGYYHEINLAFMGMWYGRVNFEYSPTSWARFNLNYLYIGDTSKGNPANVSTGGVINSPVGARQDVDKDKVGQEINLITTLNIYQGFVYNIGIAYFFPGDVYDRPSKSADGAYAINTKLQYAF